MKHVNKGKFMRKLNVNGWGGDKQKKVLFAKGLLVLTCWTTMSLVSVHAAVLKNIQFSGLPGNKVQVELALDSAPGQLKSFSTDNPARIAIDLMGVSNDAGKATLPIDIGKAVSVRALEAGGRTRVVVNLNSATPYSTKVEGNSVFITLGQVNNSVKPVTQSPVVRSSIETGKAVTSIDFRRGEEGEGRVLVNLSSASSVVDVKQQGDKVIVDIKGASLAAELANRLDVLDFATPVKTIDVTSTGDGVRLSITPMGVYEFLSYQMDKLLIVEFKPLTEQQQEELAADKFLYTGEKLSLNFQSIEVRSVLQLLADFTDMNLVASDSVGGSVTLRLNNVPWDQALDIILKSKGLAKRITGNVMMVGPEAEVVAQEKFELEANKQIEELSPLVSEFIEISYGKAEDVAEMIKGDGDINSSSGSNSFGNEEQGLVSKRGSVTVDLRTNTIIIRETVEKIVELKRIIRRLDRPVRQVMIESRIVIANDDFTRDLGVRFGLSGVDQSNDSVSLVAGSLGNGVKPSSVFDVGGSEGLLVDLPANNPAGAIQFLVGKIGSSLLQLELSALQKEEKGELISSPRVVTANQVEATIYQGVQVPYTTRDDDGTITTEFEPAELRLTVTPQITPDDRVNLEIEVKKDSPDYANATQDGQIPINTQGVTTSALVSNGDTVILGGIYERETGQQVSKVPFFGDLPGVGVLFKKELKTDNNRELLFFITPKILKDNLSVN